MAMAVVMVSSAVVFSDLGLIRDVSAAVTEITLTEPIVVNENCSFDAGSTWSELKNISNSTETNVSLTTTEALNKGTTVTAEVWLDKDADFSGSLKVQGVARVGDDWTWVDDSNIPELTIADFELVTRNDVQYKVATITHTISKDDITADVLKAFTYKIAGCNCTYNGSLRLANFKLTNGTADSSSSGDNTLEVVDDMVLSDLSTVEDYNNWSVEGGWQYSHGTETDRGPEIAYDSTNKTLKVSLDYTKDSAQTWSEAKVKYTPSDSVDVSNYNLIKVDIIYPAGFDAKTVKFYSDGLINGYLAIDTSTATDAGNGMKKVTVTLKFSPSATPLESVTVGIVGNLSSFKGDIFLDNLTLSQENPATTYVEITSEVGSGTTANISNAPESVKVSDSEMDSCAKALLAYLHALVNNNQVLFGHQNDISRSVSSSAEYGDVYDITGQLSGIYGIDSLSLLDTEAGGTDAASALSNSISYSLKAAEKGAIISLSMHMPNFSNSAVVKNADGTYSFFGCNFAESKDLSNNIATQILPGGKYNSALNAYLDVIAEYAEALQEENIPIIFRPYHENNGNWFWWGSSNTAETYKSLWRYTKDYLEEQGVHNMIWIYSPGGPFASETEYLEYYPGNEYVDILAFDYYDDYNTYPAGADTSFFDSLDKTCKIVSDLAKKNGKLAAISECGVRVMKADGSDYEGLLVKGNPVGTAASGINWYQKVSDIAKANDMPYYLVWANFSDTNFYVPYKYNSTYGQELINDFIDYFNDESSVFAGGTNFYNNLTSLASNTTANKYNNVSGYMTSPFDMDEILSATTLSAVVKKASKVQFVIENTATGAKVTIDTYQSKTRSASTIAANTYYGDLTDDMMKKLGKTDVAVIKLVADGVVIAELTNISVGKEKDKAPAYVLEDFDYYSGSDGLLGANYTSNSAAGCSSSLTLTKDHVIDGIYGGAFNYHLVTTGSEVWTGQNKTNLVSGDFSAYNAIEMWVCPDGKGQKFVVQIADESGEEFEVYLTDFVSGTEPKYITIPFSSFKGKNGGTLDTSKITKFAVWCNSVIPEGHTGTWEVDSAIYFDGVKGIALSAEILAANSVDKNGLIITDKSLATEKTNNVDDSVETGDSTSYGILLILMCAAFVLTGSTVIVTNKKTN